MTVATDQNRKTFAGNGATTSFGTSPVVFFDTSDLVVYVTDADTGEATTLVENTDYTVTGGAGSTGTVSLAAGSDPYGAPASGTTLVLVRILPLTSEFDPQNNDGSDADALEDAIDRQTMIAQQQQATLDRTVRLAASDVSGVNTEVSAVGMAGYFLRVNADGDALEFAEGDINDSSFTQSGTGAVARSVTSKIAEIVSVTDFGAVGDCTFAGVGTDDTAAIQAAITYAASRPWGGAVFFPARIYKTTSAIAVPDKVNLLGEKSGWTNNAGSAWRSGAAIYKAHTGDGVTMIASNSGGRISDLAVLSNNVTYAAGHGFVVGPATNCRLERCHVFKVGGDSFVIGDNTANSYLNSAFDCYGNNPLARNFVIASKWFVGRSLVSDGGTYGELYLSNATEFSVQDSHHEGWSAAGIKFDGGGIGEITGHNTLVASGTGIIGVDIANTSGSQLITLRNFHINGFANASGSRGVRLGGSNNLECVLENSIIEVAERGVEVNGARFRVSKNTFNGCNKAFVVNADYFKFVGNDVTATVDAQVGVFTAGTYGQYDGNNLDKILAAVASGLSTNGQLNGSDTNTAKGNKGWLTKTSGTTGSISTGATVAHGLPFAPSDIFVSAIASYTGQVYATSDATNITFNFGGGGTNQFSWTAQGQCVRQA